MSVLLGGLSFHVGRVKPGLWPAAGGQGQAWVWPAAGGQGQAWVWPAAAVCDYICVLMIH